ncbi:MAG: 3,4-dihydroxyphenylacetate 2,3-dioxygenase [Maritimibacter sp.]
MGEIVLAAKVTHVPTLQMSEQEGPIKGRRQPAIDGLLDLARRAKALEVDTVVICDTHWLINAGFHINAREDFEGLLTSSEFPQFIKDMPYSHRGHPALGHAIAKAASDMGAFTLAHEVESLDLEYGTLVPMHFMSREHDMKVISIAAFCTTHDHDESRIMGEAIRKAVEASESRVMLLASGSLSHQMWSNRDYAPNDGTFNNSSEFNQQVDLMVLEMWKRGDHATFLKMLGDYAVRCSGEGAMHDTAMLYGALGWDSYAGKCEIITPYFPSSGTGQVNVLFPV